MGPVTSPLRGIALATMTEHEATFLGVGMDTSSARAPVDPDADIHTGYYREGKGKDLGYPLEFRSQLGSDTSSGWVSGPGRAHF